MSNRRPSTLFTPPSPRSSSTLLPVTPHISSSIRSRVQKEHATTDEHGYFVTVSANEDPLSLLSASSNPSLGVPTTFELDIEVKDHLSLTPSLLPASSIAPTSSQSPSCQPTRTDNASLSLFGKFVQNAKHNSDIRRKGLMDELLKFDNEPLYFLHNGIERPLKKR